MQHEEVEDPKEGAPQLWELPSVKCELGYEILPFAIVGSKPVDSWIEFQLIAQGEDIAETTITSDDDQITVGVLMDVLENYRYWNDHLQQINW